MLEGDNKKFYTEKEGSKTDSEQMEQSSKAKQHTGQKGAIRRLEGLIELSVLTILYFLVWRYYYQGVVGPDFMGEEDSFFARFTFFWY